MYVVVNWVPWASCSFEEPMHTEERPHTEELPHTVVRNRGVNACQVLASCSASHIVSDQCYLGLVNTKVSTCLF